MKKRELEIVVRAAVALTGEVEFFVIGTQAVHAYCPHRTTADSCRSAEIFAGE